MELSKFGSEDSPIRCSQIPRLLQCPLRQVMLYLNESDGSVGQAADTGSAVHRAIHAWHDGANETEAIEIMRKELAKYPQANLDTAAEMFSWYADDTRNSEADLFASETRCEFTLPCSERDETKSPIYVQGTFDQIREEQGELAIWDVKTGVPSGTDMVVDHALQIAAYAIGATAHFKRVVQPGGIIRIRDYETKSRKKVFWPMGFRLEHCAVMLDSVREIVAMIRSGNVFPIVNHGCFMCEFRNVTNCIDRLIQLGE